MKKILSLFINFLFVFNFVSVAFSVQNDIVDFESFDNYSIEQVQNVFSNALTTTQSSNNQNDKDKLVTLNAFCINGSNISFSNEKTTKVFFSYIDKLFDNNYFYKYKLFERYCLFTKTSITEYKMNFNSYIAVVLFDINNLKIINNI